MHQKSFRNLTKCSSSFVSYFQSSMEKKIYERQRYFNTHQIMLETITKFNMNYHILYYLTINQGILLYFRIKSLNYLLL